MSAYSTFKIDGIDVIFDPDTVSMNSGNLIAVNRSMGGTMYTTSHSSNSPAANCTVTISGIFIPPTTAAALYALRIKKIPVVITGGGAGGASLVGFGTAKKFIVMSVSQNPIKPRLDYPGNTEVKYAYTITLQGVD
jgi:hypothetical protein